MSEIIFVAKPTWWVEKIYPGYHKFFNELHQMFFDPRYANYTPQFTALIRHAVHNCFPQAKLCDLRIDGGNMALNPKRNIVFCFEKQTIFRKSKPEEKQKAEQALKTVLGVDKVVWVPREIGDEICHIDGYIQFLGEILCLSNQFGMFNWRISDKKFKAIKPFIDDKNILDLPYQIDENDYLSASGIYVNFLETANAVFLPQYNIFRDEEVFNAIKRYTKKPVVRVDCSKIAEYGGAVHCLTREYFK